MENILIPFGVAVAISLLATPMVRKLAFKVKAIDIPKDDRRVHKKPMPLLGGLAIYVAFVLSSFIFLPMGDTLLSIIVGGTLILISGIIDDIKGLSPKGKLIFQIGAALVLIFGDVKIEVLTNPFSSTNEVISLNGLSIPLTIFWIVGVTNTLNLIDGLDGLAAGVSSIASLSFMLVASKFNYTSIAIISAIVAGSTLGFLPYNFHPAKIFMGDTGALLLGFLLAAISIEGVMKSVATIAVIVPIIILGLPIFDTTFAIFRRFLNGKSIAEADKGHLHHRLLERGFSQIKTVLILYGISFAFSFIAILISEANSKRAVMISIIMFLITIVLALKMGLISGKGDDKCEN
ncbi:MAG: undecaprenyl/decaprenyl-phosphate alpha-N-acetylglucosaminyl 1-phosphate transferase [Tissierellia bacterium]|nr:undecaprenyl/decaprenyl-phosphate alpha-N-acetylglucosaminyl 1-phosphate transferase [Tissierellia bacterium]